MPAPPRRGARGGRYPGTARPGDPGGRPSGTEQREDPGGRPPGTEQREDPGGRPPAAAQRPLSLVAAAIVQAIEAAGVLGASVLAGIDTGSGRSYHVNSGIALTVIGVATAVALGYVAAGLAWGRRWSRTPALLTQLFAGIVSIYLVQGHRYDWGGPGLALALAGFVALLVPPSMRALASGPRLEAADGVDQPVRRAK